MTAALAINNTEDLAEFQWTPMVALSGFVHLVLFIIILFVPGYIPQTRDVKGIVYEVDLVDVPASLLKEQKTGTAVKEKDTAIPEKDSQAKRISEPQKESIPVSVTKKSVEKKTTTVKKLSSAELLDNAISKIEKKVTEDVNPLEQALSKLEKEVGKSDDQGSTGGWSVNGIAIRIYQMEIETRIKSNWSYPVAVRNQKDLQTTVTIKVSQDGSILKYEFKKRSSDVIFDESVLKAIEKSNPLPPFPEEYRKSYDEIEINFNLQDLEDS